MTAFYQYADFRRGANYALTSFLEHWNSNCSKPQFEDWELEVRLGYVRRSQHSPSSMSGSGEFGRQQQLLTAVIDRHVRFDTTIEPALFLALFHYFCEQGGASASPSKFDFIERIANTNERIVHIDEHANCVRQRKHELASSQDYESDELDVRLATCVECTVHSDACAQRHQQCFEPTILKRQRRTLVLAGIDCWHVDFTRIDDGAQHQIEIELDWPHAYARVKKRYDALAVKPPQGFEAFLKHCIIEQLIAAIERIKQAAAVVAANQSSSSTQA